MTGVDGIAIELLKKRGDSAIEFFLWPKVRYLRTGRMHV